MTDPTDRKLVEAFLARYEGWSGTEIERRIPGITQSDVSRWRLGKYAWVSEAKRDALRAALGRPMGLSEDQRRRLEDHLARLKAMVAEVEAILGGGG